MKHLNMNISSGDIVNIQIINWREDHKSAHAKIIRLIARADDPKADYIWVSQKYGIECFNEHHTSKVDQNKYKQVLENKPSVRKNSFTDKLENAFKKKYQVKYAIAMNSGASCLHAAMHAVGIKPGDEIEWNLKRYRP